MCDFLPDSVHEVLGQVESSLSLPMLIVIVLCTLQFFFYHSLHIVCVLTEIFRKKAAKRPKRKACVKRGPSMISKLQKTLCALVGVNGKCQKPKRKPSCKRMCLGLNKSDEDDDFEDEFKKPRRKPTPSYRHLTPIIPLSKSDDEDDFDDIDTNV